jgi:hypothetical protein
MTHQLFERHQDYVMTIGNLAAGQLLQGIPLALDPDAPFVLRSKAIRCQYDANRHQAGLQNVAIRYTGAGNDYKQQARIPWGLTMAYFGQQGNPKPLAPSIQYPQNGTITVDIENQGSVNLTNVQLFFRGVKLFRPGAVRDSTYPPRIKTRPWVYSSTQSGTIAASVPVQTVSQGVQYIFRPQPDSDFVLRGLTWGTIVGIQPFEVFMLLQDVDNKAYANAPVHIDVLCSNPNTGPTYPVGNTFVAPFGTGPSQPGLFYSEIFVPRNSILYYNIVRSDQSFSGQQTVDLPFQFIGSKVYQQ